MKVRGAKKRAAWLWVSRGSPGVGVREAKRIATRENQVLVPIARAVHAVEADCLHSLLECPAGACVRTRLPITTNKNPQVTRIARSQLGGNLFQLIGPVRSLRSVRSDGHRILARGECTISARRLLNSLELMPLRIGSAIEQPTVHARCVKARCVSGRLSYAISGSPGAPRTFDGHTPMAVAREVDDCSHSEPEPCWAPAPMVPAARRQFCCSPPRATSGGALHRRRAAYVPKSMRRDPARECRARS
eukprot:457641-Prymnesium_polylepis.1